MPNFEVETEIPEIDEIFEGLCNEAYNYAKSNRKFAGLSEEEIANEIDRIYNDKFVNEIYYTYSESELADMLDVDLGTDYDEDSMIILENLYDFIGYNYMGIGQTVAKYL